MFALETYAHFRFSPGLMNFCQKSMNERLFYAFCVPLPAANLVSRGRQNPKFRHCAGDVPLPGIPVK